MTLARRAGAGRLLAASLCACALAVPSVAAAQAAKPAGAKPAAAAAPAQPSLSATLTGMARAEYEAAKLLYQDGDFANSIVKYQHAYDLSKDPRLLWNVAVCEKNLRHYSQMLKVVERYQKEGGAFLTEQDRQDAAELEKTVQSLVSTVRVVVSEPGADVLVDDAKVGISPLEAPLLVDVGTHTIAVKKPGFKDFSRSERLVGASAVAIAVMLEREIHQGQLVVEVAPKEMVFLDGKAVGQGHWEGMVPSGGHTLRVTGPGMLAYQSEVVIQDNASRRVPVTLQSERGIGTTLLWAGAGTAVLLGAVIGGAFLFKPAGPSVTDGTIGPKTVQSSFHFGVTIIKGAM